METKCIETLPTGRIFGKKSAFNKRFSFSHSLLFLLFPILLSSCGNSLNWVPLSIDQNLGEQYSQQIEFEGSGMKILDEEAHPVAYKELNKMKDEIIQSGKVTHASDFQWTLKIIEDDSVLNAFCLPGGYIYVYTGLIKYLDSEDALAGVLGHEMAHADLRHGTKQMLKNSGLGLVISLIFGTDHSSLVDLGANLLSLGFSRADEKAADEKGVEYLYPTKFDARGGSIFFRKLIENQKAPEIAEIISTHPEPEKRINDIQKKWKALGSKKGKQFIKDYQAIKSDLP